MNWRTGLAAMTLATIPLILAGCKDESAVAAPPVPAILQQPAELPFGDRQLAEITRSTAAALDLLEPRFGKVGTRSYVVDAGAVAQLREELRGGLPQGWEKLDMALPLERGELIVYAADKHLFGVLLPPAVAEGPVVPVTVLSNQG